MPETGEGNALCPKTAGLGFLSSSALQDHPEGFRLLDLDLTTILQMK